MGISPLRLGMTTVVAAALAVAFLGQAAAGMRPDDRSGVRGPALSPQASYPDFVDRYVASHKTQLTRPDDRSGVRGPASSQLVRTAQSAPASQSGESFDWGAAGVGASTTAALLLAVGFGIGMTRRSRSRSTATA